MDEDWKRYLTMAASGALTGAGMGGIGKILGGSRSLPGILGASAAGGAVGATAIPGASYLGEQFLGAPEASEAQPYTLRAGIGGALGGATAGAGIGGIIGSGASAAAGRSFPGAAKFMGSQLPLDNIIIDAIKKRGGTKGALIGALLGGAGLGFMAADEGQQLDTIRNLARGNEVPNASN